MREIDRIEYVVTRDFIAQTVRCIIPPFKAPQSSPKLRRAKIHCTIGTCLASTFVAAIYLDDGSTVLMVPACLVLAFFIVLSILFAIPYLIELGMDVFLPVCRLLFRWRMCRANRTLLDTVVCWRFFDTGFETESVDRVRFTAWQQVQKVKILPTFWILSFEAAPTLFLPTSKLTDEVRTYVLGKFQELGVSFSNE
ncbi:hypothetical protein [Fimbriiglobus ruber]|uniref:hypothetical protein n=1 Tax=Fimbriiglobus ruber TaxID=1908690 RepID=UPI00117BA498|nr:hypothetical protein [Fimbriiglobus ruber]